MLLFLLSPGLENNHQQKSLLAPILAHQASNISFFPSLQAAPYLVKFQNRMENRM
jgi:hypothetical protein